MNFDDIKNQRLKKLRGAKNNIWKDWKNAHKIHRRRKATFKKYDKMVSRVLKEFGDAVFVPIGRSYIGRKGKWYLKRSSSTIYSWGIGILDKERWGNYTFGMSSYMWSTAYIVELNPGLTGFNIKTECFGTSSSGAGFCPTTWGHSDFNEQNLVDALKKLAKNIGLTP